MTPTVSWYDIVLWFLMTAVSTYYVGGFIWKLITGFVI